MTPKQRGSLHVWLEQYATKCNEAGITRKEVADVIQIFGIPWTLEGMKEIFRGLGTAMYGKKSTEDLDPHEFQEVQKVFEEIITEVSEGNVWIPWPKDDPIESYEELRAAR